MEKKNKIPGVLVNSDIVVLVILCHNYIRGQNFKLSMTKQRISLFKGPLSEELKKDRKTSKFSIDVSIHNYDFCV